MKLAWTIKKIGDRYFGGVLFELLDAGLDFADKFTVGMQKMLSERGFETKLLEGGLEVDIPPERIAEFNELVGRLQLEISKRLRETGA